MTPSRPDEGSQLQEDDQLTDGLCSRVGINCPGHGVLTSCTGRKHLQAISKFAVAIDEISLQETSYP